MTIRSDPPVVDLDIVTPLPDAELGGPVGLADGRTILLPAVPLPEPASVKGNVAQRRLDLQRNAYHLRLTKRGPLRGVVVNGRLVAIAGPRPLVNPVDLAVLRASGLDVDAAISAFRDAIVWHVEHFEPTPHAYPQGFFTTILENRLTAVADIDGAMYSDGELSLQATMPDIVLSALVGRPLSELVDLPSLRALDPVIHSAERRDGPFEPTPRILVGICDPEGWHPVT